MALSGLADILTLGAVLPFLGMLAGIEAGSYPVWCRGIMQGFEQISNFILQLGNIRVVDPYTTTVVFAGLFMALAIGAGAVRIALLWGTQRFSSGAGIEISCEVFRRTLYQPYLIHTGRNSSKIVNDMTVKVGQTVLWINAFLGLVSSGLVVVVLSLTLVLLSPALAAGSALFLGASYLGLAFFTHRRLNKNSEIMAQNQIKSVKIIQEGLGAVRDVLIDGLQPYFCSQYRKADTLLRRAYANVNLIGHTPRYVLETAGMLLFAGIALFMARQANGLQNAIPILGVLALGAQRLLPSLQQAYMNWSFVVGYRECLADVLELLAQPVEPVSQARGLRLMGLKKEIRFQNVSFSYPSSRAPVLKNLSFKIPKGALIGIVGKTGSGKSTFLDLLMGLLEPSSGKITVDGIPLAPPHMGAWQASLAHVPQSIYLADDSLLQNIAFGISRQEIEPRRVHQAAQAAEIAEFIQSLPDQYQTPVGERGIRLSGGQRQRIGLARALYKATDILVLDEATNALDVETENRVLKNLLSKKSKPTVLMVTHRLASLKSCDFLLELPFGNLRSSH